MGWNDCLDHLAASGYLPLAPNPPKIDGLDEASREIRLQQLSKQFRDQFSWTWTRNEIYRGMDLLRWLSESDLLSPPQLSSCQKLQGDK
jgi:hypothetical protein